MVELQGAERTENALPPFVCNTIVINVTSKRSIYSDRLGANMEGKHSNTSGGCVFFDFRAIARRFGGAMCARCGGEWERSCGGECEDDPLIGDGERDGCQGE
jgi:hypothetical protein